MSATTEPRHPCPYCGTMLDEDDCVESDIPAVNGPTLHSESQCREYVYCALQSYKRELAQARAEVERLTRELADERRKREEAEREYRRKLEDACQAGRTRARPGDAAQCENARLVAALSEAVAWLGAAKRSGTFDPKTYEDIDRAFWAARNALSSCSPAPAAEGPPRWRVGRTLGRTLYRDEMVVGLVDTPELAAEIVAAVNKAPPETP